MPDFSRFAVFARKGSPVPHRSPRRERIGEQKKSIIPNAVPHVPLVPQESDIGGDEARWRDAFEERAAILEYDGGFSRSEAERLARIEIEALRKTSGI